MAQATTTDYSSLSALERDTLITLGATPGEPSGNDVWKRLYEARDGPERSSAFYRALEALVEADLVEKRPNPDDGRSNLYSLTDHGAAALRTQAENINDAL
jgi:DNA-binding MarR family transcriptional regulator